MPEFTAKQLIKRYDNLLLGRRYWEPHWQEIADHLIPRKGNITTTSTRGEKRHKNRFSSVGTHSHEVLTANLQGTLTSRSFRWFGLGLDEEDELNEQDDVRDWLHTSSRKMWRQLNASNFHSQAHEFYTDITGFGTGMILLEEKEGRRRFNGVTFRTYPIESYVFEEDSDGIPNAVGIRLAYTAAQAIDKFGKEILPDKITMAFEEDPQKPWAFIHWIYPRRQRDKDKVDSLNMSFASAYVSMEGEKIVKEGGYNEFPAMIARWTLSAGEKYGRGPGNTALPDLKVLDKATELELNGWAKHIDPPWFMLDDGVIGKVNLKPGKGTVLRDKDALWFYEWKGRPDIGRIKLDELRATIKQTFFADQLELPQSDRMTAEEIRTRIELMQRVLGPTLGRLETEFLNQLIERLFGIMSRAGALPPVPQELLEREEGEVEVKYTGPLARSERIAEVNQVLRLVDLLTPLAQINPSVMDVLDTDESARFMATELDIPEKLTRSQDVIDEIRGARAEQQQAQQAIEAGVSQSVVTKNLAQARMADAGG
jgi:hypothetical protein